MNSPRRTTGPLVTLFVVALIATALVIQNVRPRRLTAVRDETWSGTWEVETVVRGWPLPHQKQIDATFAPAGFHYDHPVQPVTYLPQLDWNNPQFWALAANAVFGLSMLMATGFVIEYWRRLRTAPLQFHIRTIFVLTFAVAVSVALFENDLVHWSILLLPFLAFAIVGVPAAAGIGLNHYLRRFEQRLSRLRMRYSHQNRG